MAPSTPDAQARFLPGAMIAGRYRVVALLGRGGMGEVYRADDTKLGEAVALKFLPERLENDALLRERFLGEARLARAVAHPNVCRVYDVGEVGGRLFLSMEYVDGEDLATLLRRIGRLPEAKAVQIAHEICMGLHAAHEQGIVHRDLKPSNVMLDGRGHARITDFGLAAVASAIDPSDLAAGTPAYMAPEQMLGQEVTPRSDIYALGLVLVELFTGRPAFEIATTAEEFRRRESSTPQALGAALEGVDPAIGRVLARCLRADPSHRPASAAAVALALPGGDPLAAALAAGETPSPEMIAEAGGADWFPRWQAWAWFGAVLATLAVVFALAPHYYLIQRAPIEKPPAVLFDRARDVATAIGWPGTPRDESATMLYDTRPATAMAQRFGQAAVLRHLRRYSSDTFTLLYRRSPHALLPLDPNDLYVGILDPPLNVPGMLSVRIDGAGRLHSFEGCPPEFDSSAAVPGRHADWAACFALAGLDTARFRRIEPRWSPRTFADERFAWLGTAPGDSAIALRIEAASYRGMPVEFRRVHEWTLPLGAGAANGGAGAWFVYALFFSLLAMAGWAARRNLRAGRSDARGALRLGVVAGILLVIRHWTGAHLAAEPQWLFNRVMGTIGHGSVLFLLTAMLYLTLEPVVRRTWPHALVSWMRLLDGRWRDRRLGRDVLAGLAVGIGLQIAMTGVAQAWSMLMHQPLPADLLDNPATQTDAVMGTGATLSVLLATLLGALQSGLLGAALIALLTIVLKRRVLSLVISGAVVMVLNGALGQSPVGLIATVVVYGTIIFMFVRFGFVSLFVTATAYGTMSVIPLVLPGSSWYWPSTAVGLAGLLGAALLSLRAMLAGAGAAAPASRPPSGSMPIVRSVRGASAPLPAREPTPRPNLSSAPTVVSPRPQGDGDGERGE